MRVFVDQILMNYTGYIPLRIHHYIVIFPIREGMFAFHSLDKTFYLDLHHRILWQPWLEVLRCTYSETVNRAKANLAFATSCSVYSCRPSSRGSPKTPMTKARSPIPTTTCGALAGISKEIPNRLCMASIEALWLGFRQGTTPSATTAFAASGVNSSLRMEQTDGNMEGAIPKPK